MMMDPIAIKCPLLSALFPSTSLPPFLHPAPRGRLGQSRGETKSHLLHPEENHDTDMTL
jgi:hypothetical protein